MRIEPAATIARVGGGGGPIAAVPAQFEAIGYMNGPDGEAGTDDDVRIGMMKATWSNAEFDDFSRAMEDTKFAGQLDAGSGLFSPAVPGPNPARRWQANNIGNLAITGTVNAAGNEVSGSGQLFVTVQRFVDPPIR